MVSSSLVSPIGTRLTLRFYPFIPLTGPLPGSSIHFGDRRRDKSIFLGSESSGLAISILYDRYSKI